MSKSKLKRQLLATFLAVAMAITSVNLTPFGTVTAHATEGDAEGAATLTEGEYYIINVGSGGFLNGGNKYDVHASALPYGTILKIRSEGGSTYIKYSDSMYMAIDGGDADVYMDNGGDKKVAVTITSCGDDSYTITKASDSKKYLTAGAAEVIVDGEKVEGNRLVGFESPATEGQPGDYAKWRFLTRAQYIAEVQAAAVTSDNGIDVTSLIGDSQFSRNNPDNSKWQGTIGTSGNWNEINNGDNYYCREGWHRVFTREQTITDIPNGVYELNIRGAHENTNSSPVYYINGIEHKLKLKTDEPGLQVPSTEPAKWFALQFAKGKYLNETIRAIVTDGKLTIGIKIDTTDDWVIWRGFTLELLDVVVPDVIDKIETIGTVEFTYQSRDKVNAAKDAYNALSEKQQDYIPQAQKDKLNTAVAKWQELFDANNGEEGLEAASIKSVEDKIAEIGDVEFTPESKAKIDAAREAYDALREDLKVKVPNRTTLTEAEAAYDQAAAADTITKIDAIGTVKFTYECRIAIEAARTAYNALTESQQAIVKENGKYEVLTAAEDAYELAKTPLLEVGKEYYIINTETDRFLNAGDAHGTHAAALTYGQLMSVEDAGDGMYSLNTRYNNGYLFANENAEAFMDGGTPDKLRIEVCENGNYVISAASGTAKNRYLSAFRDGNKIKADYRSEKTELSEWRFITRQEFVDYAVETVTADNAVDVTSLIYDSHFGYENKYVDKWKMNVGSSSVYRKADGYYKVYERWQAEALCEQEITDIDIPNGVYALSVDAFNRSANDAAPAQYYINDTAKNVKEGNEDKNGNTSALDVGREALRGGTKYKDDPLIAIVTDHKLKVGLKMPATGDWVVWGPFTLELLDVVVPDVVIKINAIGKVEYSYLSRDKIGAARKAYDDLSEKQQGYITEAQLGVLTKAEEDWEKIYNESGKEEGLEQATIDIVEAKIDQIGAVADVAFTTEYKNKIAAAREAYDALEERLQQRVKPEKLTQLEEAEAAYDQAAAADTVAKIDAIGAVKDVAFTYECRIAIETARAAYNALTKAQKDIITSDKTEKLRKLLDAEDAYAELAKTPVLADNKYYIVNAATGKYLNGANNAGTQASALTYGQWMTVAVNESGNTIYTIDTHCSNGGDNHFLGSNGYIDSPAAKLTIEKFNDGSCYIATNDGKFLTAPVTGESTIVTFDDEMTEGSKWLFLTREELIEKSLNEVVTADNGVDVTSLILDSNFSRNNSYFSNWEGEGDKKPAKGGDNDNQCVEVWTQNGGITFDSYQKIEGVPNGVYELTVQGFYRTTDRTKTQAPVYYINEEKGELKFVQDEGEISSPDATEANGWTTDKLGNGIKIPDSKNNASKCFNTGAYKNGPIRVKVINHTITVGMKATMPTADDWVIWDNFTLKLVNADAEFADRVVTLFGDIGEIDGTDECKARIKAAREAYDALTKAQKDEIAEQLKVLTDAEAVAPVVDKINAIGTVSYNSGDKIKEADEAFEALSDDQQGLVTNAETLTAAKTAYSDFEAAAAVEKLIEDIDDIDDTDATKEKIETARAAFKNLSKARQDLVRNKAKLDAAEAQYDQLKAAKVEELIRQIGNVELTEESNIKITTARNAFDALTSEQQELVTNKADLIAAEAKYKDLADKDPQAANQVAANAVKKLIDDIGTPVTLDSKDKIEAARKAYNDLTPERKALVGDAYREKLEEAERQYNQAAANVAIAKINAIGEIDGTDDCKTRIDDAEKAYNALTDAQKAIVGEANHQKITDAKASHEVVKKISAIGTVDATDECKTRIDDAEKAYNALTDAQKALVGETNHQKITDAKASHEVIKKINAIGTVDATDECKTRIDDAEKAYNALTADQKAIVGEANHQKITDAKAEYDRLLAEQDPDAINQAAAQKVIDLIEAIGTVDATNADNRKAAIDEARKAYDDLTDAQKAIVTEKGKLTVLTDAEAKYDEIKVNAVVELFNAIGDVDGTDASKARIDEARKAYNALTRAQKGKVEADKLKVLTDAEAATAVIEKINAMGDVSLKSSAKITVAREAYNALTDDQKKLVKEEQLNVLTNAETSYAGLVAEEGQEKADIAAAEGVTEEITAIGEVKATEECRVKIEAARAYYNALTAEQKALVTEEQLKVLTDAEAQYEELTKDLPASEELKEELAAAVQEAEAEKLVEAAYTEDSWKEYKAALETLQAVSKKQNATKGEVQAALKAYTTASEGLVVKDEYQPSKEQRDALTTAVTDATKLDSTQYIQDENWTAFTIALKRAQTIQDRSNATKDQVQTAMDDLDAAIKKLTPAQKAADKTDLNKAVEAAKKLKEKTYTPSTWKNFETALKAADAVAEKPDATQQEVDDALKALEAKQKALKKAVTSITITDKATGSKTIKIAAGKKVTLKATAAPKDASSSVTWSVDSKSKNLATVNKKTGVVTIKKNAGGKKVSIIATAKDGSKKTQKVTITVMKNAVTKVTLKAAKKVKAGRAVTIKATVKTNGKKANKAVFWSIDSKSAKYASINSKGKLKTKKTGAGKKVTVTATSTDGTNKKAKVTITLTK